MIDIDALRQAIEDDESTTGAVAGRLRDLLYEAEHDREEEEE